MKKTDFLSTPLPLFLEQRLSCSPEEQALKLFQSTAADVPAYRDFLESQGIDPASITTVENFQDLPLTTKENYIRAYPLPRRCREGALCRCEMIAVSSGSTGIPLFWPRSTVHEMETAARFEQVFSDSFRAKERTSLAVICFTLGTWVGGMFTSTCCRYLAQKGYPITLVTPGNHREEIFRCIQELGPFFDQVVLLGYPPFLKDVIDTGIARGIDWKPYHLKLVMAGEVFSEEWRSLVGERTGSCEPLFDSASLYGTADAGVLGNETPLSICIRRFLSAHPDAARQLFGESRLPTLVQYDPLSRFFEVRQGSLLFSGDNGVPLIRYHIADSGGLVPYSTMISFLQDWKFDPLAELAASTLSARIYSLPFVFVFGRSDFTVSYFGANIYPENVTVGLEQDPIPQWTSGKFVLQTREDPDHNRILSIVVEMLPGIEGTEERRKMIAESILEQLLRLNSEFANYVPPEYRMPEVTLAPAGHQEYFPAGVKHRYTRR